MKINVKWWKIKMKSTNLTQINLRIDPINRRIQGFSFRKFEDECWCSRLDFSLVFRLKVKFMHSNEAESSCERTGTNGARNHSLNNENFAKDREPVLRREERFLNKTEIWFPPFDDASIAINGLDYALFDQSVVLICDHPITIVRRRFNPMSITINGSD